MTNPHVLSHDSTGQSHGVSLTKAQLPPSSGQLSAEDRATMFIEWCALQKMPGWRGLPLGAYDQLVAHIRQGERPFPLKD